MTDHELTVEEIEEMSSAEQARTINGRRYRVHRLPYYKGMAVLKLLKEVAGDSLFGVLRSGLDAMTMEVVGTLINLIGNLGDPRMIEALNAMSTGAEMLGEDHSTWVQMIDLDRNGRIRHSHLDTHFQLYPEDVLPYLSFVLEVNYRAFFTGGSSELSSLMSRLPPEVQKFLEALKEEGSKFLEGLIGSSGELSDPDTEEPPSPTSETNGVLST